MQAFVRTAFKPIFGIFSIVLLLMPFSSLAVNNTLPGAGINSSKLFLEIGRSGGGSSLHAPTSYIKLAYTGNPTWVGIYDGAYCVGSDYDTNDVGGGTSGYTSPDCNKNYVSKQEVDYTFYPYDNQHSRRIGTGQVVKTNTMLAENNTTWVDLRSLAHIDNDSNDLHYVILKASFKLTDPGLGGVNAFKVTLNTQANQGTSLGYVTFDSQDTAAEDLPFSVQNRVSGGPDTMKFEFAPGCDVSSDQAATLHWTDADTGVGNQPDAISWKLFDEQVSATSPIFYLNTFSNGTSDFVRNGSGAIVTDLNGFRVTMGGSGQDRQFKMMFHAYHKYRWEWSNVDKANGLQFFLPYDSLGYKFGCSPVKVVKDVLAGSTVTTGSASDVGNATVYIKYGSHTTVDDSSTVQGHTFNVPEGKDTIVVASPYTNPSTNTKYTAIGYRLCDLTSSPRWSKHTCPSCLR